jgi:hypothetical protein
MPHDIIQMPNEPIIVSRYTEAMTAELVRAANERIRGLIGRLHHLYPHIYEIVDVSTITGSFAEMLAVLRVEADSDYTSLRDPNVTVLLVGNAPMVKFYQQAIQQEQFGGAKLPMFSTYEAALEHARFKIEQAKTS